jgi:hypothetical protein
MVKTIALIVLLLTTPAIANGQLRGFVGAGLASSTFNVSSIAGPSPSTTYTNDFDPGRLFGVTGEAGIRIGGRFTLGAEVWLPWKSRTITQEFDYLVGPPYRRISNYRERAILFVFDGRLTDGGRVTAAWSAGAGLIKQTALERRATYIQGTFFEFGPFGDLRHVSSSRVGFTGGAEVAIKATRHLSVVPQFRLLYVPRGDKVYAPNSFTSLGLNSLSSRIGASVRALF